MLKDREACGSACLNVQINQVYRSNHNYIETVHELYLVLIKMMIQILIFDIPGAGHPTEFTQAIDPERSTGGGGGGVA